MGKHRGVGVEGIRMILKAPTGEPTGAVKKLCCNGAVMGWSAPREDLFMGPKNPREHPWKSLNWFSTYWLGGGSKTTHEASIAQRSHRPFKRNRFQKEMVKDLQSPASTFHTCTLTHSFVSEDKSDLVKQGKVKKMQ